MIYVKRIKNSPCKDCGAPMAMSGRVGRPRQLCDECKAKRLPPPPEPRLFCANGHRLLGNRIMYADGQIRCAECQTNAKARYYGKKRANESVSA